MADALAAALQKRKEKVSRSGKFLLFPLLWLVYWLVLIMVCR
jgi:hypothetical protein